MILFTDGSNFRPREIGNSNLGQKNRKLLFAIRQSQIKNRYKNRNSVLANRELKINLNYDSQFALLSIFI